VWQEIQLENADIRLLSGFLPDREATLLLDKLREDLDWQRDSIRLFGKCHPIPRLHQWYGDAGAKYRWSGLVMQPLPWTPELAELKARIEAVSGARFNAVLANLYRDGNDSMGWHADDEPELGEAPVIASLSLGAGRDFAFRDRMGARPTKYLHLEHGSLLVMAGTTQQHWQHALPRRRRVSEARINLTFRQIDIARSRSI
jgi:alkylated DNA repair dioxygenase AlkB